jgi:hypothetical protein
MVLIVQAGAPSSSVGTTGDIYIDSTDQILYGPKISSTEWPTTGMRLTSLINGSAIFLTGALTPTLDIGSVGNYYFATGSSMLYGPKTSTSWPIVGRFVPVNGGYPNVLPCTGGHKCHCPEKTNCSEKKSCCNDCSKDRCSTTCGSSSGINIFSVLMIAAILVFIYMIAK